MAEAFDRWLPYIQPIAEALIDLADISKGQSILDVASGTGEPSLTLARRYGKKGISIVGVDGAEAMVARANQKAEAEALTCLQFRQMKAEALDFENAQFDRVISRFGVMLFDDPLLGVSEMRRVLRHGGKMVIAIWGEFYKIPSLYLIWDVLMKAMPKDKQPFTPRIGGLGAEGVLDTLLEEAGFEEDYLEIKPFILTYRYDDFESYWEISTSAGMLKEPLDSLSAEVQSDLKKKVEKLTLPYCENGKIVFHNEAILASCVK